MALIKAHKKHKLGNMIVGLCSIIDGICLFFSLGNWNPNLQLEFNMYRRRNNFLLDFKN